jgi:DNA-binding IclR family transcriptional regulator
MLSTPHSRASSSSVKSAERALSILSYLATKNAPVPCMTIARGCSLPRSSTYHLLNVLLDGGFVVHYPERRRWGLGPAVVPIADAFRRSRPLPWLGQAVFDDLVGGGVLAGSLHRVAEDALSVCAHRSGHVATRVDPLEDPAHREAAALAVATGLGPEEARRLLRRLGRDHADRRFLEGFDAEHRHGRHRGHVARAGAETGVVHIAAPVMDDRSSPRAALVLACRAGAEGADPSAVERLRTAARELSAGFVPGRLAAA